MPEQKNTGLDFEIDELTDSIRNVVSNDSFQTTISRITKSIMKTKRNKKELDVDFIGGQEPLTKEEEDKLSEYFTRKMHRKTREKPRQKETA